MTEYDLWKIFPRMPKKVTVADITIRDGFQHLEIYIPLEAKIYYTEQLIYAGCREIELTNLGNPHIMPQFKDAEEILKHFSGENFKKSCAKRRINYDDLKFRVVTIREKSVDKAIELKKSGIKIDEALMMVSTEEEHHFANSGTTLPNYWKECERAIKKCDDAGIKMCGTVSTIWGSPIGGKTELKDAIEFTKRWLDIGASIIEHADHDGHASARQVYRYFSMLLDEIPNPDLHFAHFHETRRIASASVLAALMAGIIRFEATLGGLGGQPANFLDRCPVPGTGEYYYDPRCVGLMCLEDTLVQLEEMGIEHGWNIDKVILLGRKLEKTCGGRLRSEAIIHGTKSEEGHPEYARPGLAKLKEKLGEKPGQRFPSDWK